jgi:hypothetical protein
MPKKSNMIIEMILQAELFRMATRVRRVMLFLSLLDGDGAESFELDPSLFPIKGRKDSDDEEPLMTQLT